MEQNSTIKPAACWPSLLISLAAAAAMATFFFWPIHSHLLDGIPAGDDNRGSDASVQPMQPGDHLQLMYHFWMFTDMVSGKTPWFYNLYEFNIGDDQDRKIISTYYVPFSLFFAIGFWISDHALGWNLSAFISIWLTILLTFHFIRRYTRTEWQAWLCTLFALSLPYRWLNIAGGSPTGFTMAWVPLLMIGIDRIIHERKVSGGWLAGLAILLSSLSDTHVFFFTILAAPAWMLLAVMYRKLISGISFTRNDIRPTIIALIPMVLLTGISYALHHTIKDTIKTSSAAAGRALQEVLLYAPYSMGLLSRDAGGVSDHIYIGYALLAIIAITVVAGLFALSRTSLRRSSWKLMVMYVLFLTGVGFILILALGPRGPWDGWLFIQLREIIPPYSMIRQPAKIFCLLPTFMAIVAALSFQLLEHVPKAGRWLTGIVTVIIFAGIVENKTRINTTIQTIEQQQSAYQAVAIDATLRKEIPRLLVVTLWPGDAHIASVYQHFASMYHIRMINGYFPFVKADYIENVFKRLESVNMGLIDDEQIKWLNERGIHYIIVHENNYLEKVSAFPISYALMNFMRHPRLELLKQDGPVWAFRLLEHPKQTAVTIKDPTQWPSGRFREAEQFGGANKITMEDASANNGRAVRLSKPGETLESTSIDYGPVHNPQWALRVRGNGLLHINRFVENFPAGEIDVRVFSDDWEWVYVALPQPETRRDVHLGITLMEGAVDIDMVQLLAGRPIDLKPGDSWSMPAAHFFHAGYSSPDFTSVIFDPWRESAGTFMYGPKLPFPAGQYEVSVDFSTDAPDGVQLGVVAIHVPDGQHVFSAEFKSGTSFVAVTEIPNNRPLNIIISMREHPYSVTFNTITMKRIR